MTGSSMMPNTKNFDPEYIEKIVTGKSSAKEVAKAQSQLEHAEMREDNAIQRRVADYQAAGLNPALALGGEGASSMAATQTLASSAQETQANASQMNALTNLVSTALSIFLMKGAGLGKAAGKIASNTAKSVKNYYYLGNLK